MTGVQAVVPGSQAPVLVPGELRAYRAWKYGAASVAGEHRCALRLRALTWGTVLDTCGGVHTAVCVHQPGHRLHNPQSLRRHEPGWPIPSEHCTCGFYGTVAGGLNHSIQAPATFNRAVTEGSFFFGSVVFSGRVVIGAHGVARAEKMRLESVLSLTAVWNATAMEGLRRISEDYGVPIFADPVHFTESFPLNDLSALGVDLPDVPPDLGLGMRDLLVAQRAAHDRNLSLGRCACAACDKRYLDFTQEAEQRARAMEELMKSLPTSIPDWLGGGHNGTP